MLYRQIILFLISITVLFSGCVSSNQQRDLSPTDPGQSLLRVGITSNAPPMAYREHGKYTGLEVELAKGLARYTQRKLRFVELPWEEQIPALLAGKTDIIMSAMSVTDARRYQIAFTNPYLISGQIALVRLADYNRYSDGLSSLLSPTVRVGTIKATTGDFLITRRKSKGMILHLANPDKGAQAVLNNEVDAFVYDLPMNLYLAARYNSQGLAPVVVPMSREEIAWGVRPDDHKLLSRANAYLATLKKSTQLQNKIIHWIPFYGKLFNH